jgi:hypothetical protein
VISTEPDLLVGSTTVPTQAHAIIARGRVDHDAPPGKASPLSPFDIENPTSDPATSSVSFVQD